MIPKTYMVTFTGEVKVFVNAYSENLAIENAKGEAEDASYYKDGIVLSVKDLKNGIAKEVV
jgi:hypothetical protein